jgi:SAM-dependent methyltransferase
MPLGSGHCPARIILEEVTVFMKRATRGFGLFESFLSRRRGSRADSLIPSTVRRGRILDVGCGTFPSFLMSIQFHEKSAVDKHDPSSLTSLLGPDTIYYHQFDIEKGYPFPFDREFFDVVTMLAVVEHLEPDCVTRVVGEIYQILKPGGLYILTTPAPWTKGLLKGMSIMRLVSPNEIGEHKCAYDHSDIAVLLGACGFDTRGIHLGSFEFQMNLWAMAIK